MSPFDIVKSINKHNYLNDVYEGYKPRVINQAFSMFQDTLLQANYMNLNYELDYKMQYDFLFYTIKPRSRFEEWLKEEKKSSDMLAVQEYYGYNTQKARQALSILKEEQLTKIKEELVKGG